MTLLQVRVVSSEIIKPSSPTPDHLRHYRFSFLDQTAVPHMYGYVILFFESSDGQLNMTEISKILKQSLADVLTLYYPFAGRAHENLYIYCNDHGIPFLVADVDTSCKLSDVLLCNSIPADDLTKLVPFELEDADNLIPLGVQLNLFACGGFAIGQCISHKIADGASMLMFSKAWAATARRALAGDDDRAKAIFIQPPEFVAAKLFPPNSFAKPIVGFSKNNNLTTRRFVFDATDIENLRAKYVDLLERPTRVETLSAFIWSRLVAVSKEEEEDATHGHHNKFHCVAHMVNLRPRFDPPLPLHSFGNLMTFAISTPLLSNTSEECYGLARLIRKAIKTIDKGYINKVQDYCVGYSPPNDPTTISDSIVTSAFTSLCNYPMYDDDDFGWGRPAWVAVGVPRVDIDNGIIFSDTRDATGIEVSITTSKEVLTKLERDNEFLKMIRPSSISSGYSSSRKPAATTNINIKNRARM